MVGSVELGGGIYIDRGAHHVELSIAGACSSWVGLVELIEVLGSGLISLRCAEGVNGSLTDGRLRALRAFAFGLVAVDVDGALGGSGGLERSYSLSGQVNLLGNSIEVKLDLLRDLKVTGLVGESRVDERVGVLLRGLDVLEILGEESVESHSEVIELIVAGALIVDRLCNHGNVDCLVSIGNDISALSNGSEASSLGFSSPDLTRSLGSLYSIFTLTVSILILVLGSSVALISLTVVILSLVSSESPVVEFGLVGDLDGVHSLDEGEDSE